MRYSKVFKQLACVYVALSTLRMVVLVVLQLCYIYCQDRSNGHEGFGRQSARKLSCSDSIYRLMELIGSNYRLLNTALFVYTYLSIMSITKHFWQLFVVKRYVPLEENSFYVFLRNPKVSQRRIRKKIVDRLDELIESNQNYLDSINRQVASLDSLDANYASFGSMRADGSLNWSKSRRSREQRCRLLVLAIKSQHNHLEALKRDLAPVWPLNRRDGSRRHMYQRLIVAIYAGYTACVYVLVNNTGSLWNMEVCRRHRLRSLPLYWLDVLSFFEQQLFSWFHIHWLAVPSSLVAVDKVDQLIYLCQLRQNAQKLLHKLLKARLTGHRERSLRNFSPFRCDHDALNLYIHFRSFTSELQSCLNLESVVSSQCVILALGLTLIQLPAFRTMDSSEFFLSAFANVSTLATINIHLIAAAAFNAQCMRLVKLVWSCIGAFQMESESGLELVTPHTLMLWRRLNADPRQNMEMLCSKLFGTVCINYNFVLQLNFWIISVLVLVKSTKLFA